jgi:hypothetical protein
MHKENNTKIKNINKYKKIHSLLNVLNSTRQKKLLTVSHNSCACCKYKYMQI